MNKPKALIITRNFPPLWGGMERLNWRMAQELSKAYELHLIAPQGAAVHVDEGIEVTEVRLRPLWRFLLAAAWQTLRKAWRIKPKAVIAGSGLTAPFAWFAARISGASAVVYVHGLDVVASHPVYRTLWVPMLQRMDRVIANSQATAQLTKQIGVDAKRIRIVHPGVDMPERANGSRAAFLARHGLGEGRVLLSVGRLTVRKGLQEFVRDVLPLVVAQQPDICLLVVGSVPSDALLSSVQTPESIMQAAREAGVGGHVRMLGTLFGQELSDAYFAADVHVFPVQNIPNDPEGFGMVAMEAAAHGLPTVAYATGGVMEAVEEGVSGSLVAQGDYSAFAMAILHQLRCPDAGSTDFARRFVWESFGERILNALDESDF
ncbi:MAG: glycosyltransferase family 4 protein [Pseudomonadota bacterium]